MFQDTSCPKLFIRYIKNKFIYKYDTNILISDIIKTWETRKDCFQVKSVSLATVVRHFLTKDHILVQLNAYYI